MLICCAQAYNESNGAQIENVAGPGSEREVVNMTTASDGKVVISDALSIASGEIMQCRPQTAPAAPVSKEPDPDPLKGLTISVQKTAGASLGLQCVCCGSPKVLLVDGISEPGLLANYNRTAPQKRIDFDTRLLPGDIIIRVNNTEGEDMMNELQKDGWLQLEARKSIEVDVTIPRMGQGSLGFDLRAQEHQNYVIIKDIGPGPVMTYNATAPVDRKVKVPSRILAVNGVQGKSSDLYASLKGSSGDVRLRLHQAMP